MPETQVTVTGHATRHRPTQRIANFDALTAGLEVYNVNKPLNAKAIASKKVYMPLSNIPRSERTAENETNNIGAL